ncbi:MAG: hydratase, partial [Firmicutes bacterium]|nr:hydratase [Bacillota bacterium]
FTLSRRDPAYVGKAKSVKALELAREAGKELETVDPELAAAYELIKKLDPKAPALSKIEIASAVYAHKPGDGSAREQAASCQRVLFGLANISREYATKRYRSNLINWGMIPFQLGPGESSERLAADDWIYVPDIRSSIEEDRLEDIQAFLIRNGKADPLKLLIAPLTEAERSIILAGSLINFNRNR